MASIETSPDLCVIGASEAGLAACLGAVALGLSCVLVDDGDPSGRRNPDLALAALARSAADPARHAAAWDTLARCLDRAAPDRRHARFGALNVGLVRGRARFLDRDTLQAGEVTIRARRVFIATGGTQPSRSLAAGLPAGVCLGVADLGALRGTPAAVLVAGGGAEAVSIAQSLARLGSRVTLAADALLPGVDPELARPVLAQARRDGIAVEAARLHRVQPGPSGLAATLSDGATVEATHLILAEEPSPALDGLALDRAEVRCNPQGLRLDPHLRTNQRRILAIGRAAGARSTAEGILQAGHALRTAFTPMPGRPRPDAVPHVTATQPQIAAIGHPSPDAEARIWRWPLDQTGGGILAGASDGSLKVTTDRRGRIRAVGIVGAEVRELAAFWALAVTRGLTLADLAPVGTPLPSWSEAHRAIATQEVGRRLASPWVKRAVRALRWLG